MYAELTTLLTRSGVAIAAMMLAVWLVSLIRKDASIVDIAWGLGFVLVSWTAYFTSNGGTSDGDLSLVVPVLTTIWGLRLAFYLFWRNHGRSEDFRYREMRSKWGRTFPVVSLLTVFTLQGAVMWVVSLPVQVASAIHAQGHSPLTVIGIAVWAAGIFFESVGDWQLARFKSDPSNRDRVLDTGLWRYTRHPNYFGDFLVWWGLFLVSLSLTGIWWPIVSPIVMSVLLMRISGVTLLEKSLVQSKPEYVRYVDRTNAFFPGPPRL
ncbi:MAG: DUF1295 domain-containing protein [Pirellulaceae bacterium]|nr:DUF1295 domain-containing protein [Planctomycetales bacterium]MCA9266403.1 DUF1295 domain-containing protein [Planctomycetales bacterium]